MKYVGWIVAVIAFLLLTNLVCTVCHYGDRAKTVVLQQLDPGELLRKYEWFKDCSAQLNKKLADIQVYNERQKSLTNSYDNIKRSEWSRKDREQHNMWEPESFKKVILNLNAM